MALKWNKKDTELLISSIEQYPCLYNIRSTEYLDKAKKAQAFNNILELMRNTMSTITLVNIKQKWKNVRTQYAHEQRMMKKSKKDDCGYVPKLWCFSQLYFLETNIRIGQREDNVKDNDVANVSYVQNCTEDESLIEEPLQKQECIIEAKEISGNQNFSIIQMGSLKFEENKCRICFQDDVKVDWNDYLQENDHVTYKDCYYKYTQLDCFDGDNSYLSVMLCGSCSSSLENINAFITKAIESHNLLKVRLALNIETKNFETVMISETDDVKPEIQNVSMYERNSKEYLNERSDSWSMTEGNMTFDKLTRRKRVSKRGCKQDATKTSSDELQSDRAIPKKNYHSSKPWEIPTCCSICPKILSSKYKAIQHEKIHTKNRERNDICSECGMKFFDKVSLRSHMVTHNENREKTHKCEFCDKAFYNSGALNIHRRIHLGQMIPCTLCKKEYFRQVDLDKHMISHSAARISGDLKPEKKYFIHCDICELSIRSTQYKTHSAKHMNEPLAKCAICEKEFFSRNSCVRHLKKFHKIESVERSNYVISYKTSRYSNLFLKQNVGNIFTKE